VFKLRGLLQRRRSTRFSNTVSEVLGAWILAFLLLGAGFSLLAFHERGARDAVVMPGWRAPPVAGNEEWDDPECRRAIISLSCADLPAEGNSTDRVHAPSWGGVGW